MARTADRYVRIVGGTQASRWRWQASLYHHKQFVCGATLIGSNILLTSAHCVERVIDVRDLTVRLGDYDRWCFFHGEGNLPGKLQGTPKLQSPSYVPNLYDEKWQTFTGQSDRVTEVYLRLSLVRLEISRIFYDDKTIFFGYHNFKELWGSNLGWNFSKNYEKVWDWKLLWLKPRPREAF